jgi:hypothetical protein
VPACDRQLRGKGDLNLVTSARIAELPTPVTLECDDSGLPPLVTTPRQLLPRLPHRVEIDSQATDSGGLESPELAAE